MTQWYDPYAGKYRSTLPYKLFHVWLWPLSRWFLFRIDSERAHHLGMRALRIVGKIDTVWKWLVYPFYIPFLLLIVVPGRWLIFRLVRRRLMVGDRAIILPLE